MAPRHDSAATIGLPTLILLVIASMIGIGCFLSSGYALLSLGNPQRVVLAWILCGTWAIAGAAAYGSLAKRVPLSGGEYLYLSRLMHPSIGFLAGWISLVAGFTVPIAAMAQTVVKYSLPTQSNPTLAALSASGIIFVAALLHATRVHLGAMTQNVIVAIKLLFIAGLLMWSSTQFPNASVWQGGPLTGRDTAMLPSDWSGWVALLAAMSWISLSYTGFNAAVYVAGESQQAQRNVPRAMLWATLLVMLVYVALNALFVFAADAQSIKADPESIAIIAARNVGGSLCQNLLRSIIGLAVLSSVFSMLLAGPRVYAQMAQDGVMPPILKINQGVPRGAIALQAVLSIMVVWISSLQQLIGYLGMTLAACSALAVSALWWIRPRSTASPTAPDETAIPPLALWEHASAAFYILGTCAMLAAVVATGQKREELIAMCVTFAVGFAVYWIWRSSRTRMRSDHRPKT